MIYLYYGENQYLLEEKLKVFKERYLAKFPNSLNFHQIDISDGGILFLKEVLEGMSLFDETILVFVSGIERVSQIETILTLIRDYDVAERKDIVLVFYAAVLVKEIDKKILLQIKEKGSVTEFVLYSGEKLVNWIKKAAQNEGVTINSADARYLVERKGEDMVGLSHEIKKLASYTNDGAIVRESIEVLVPSTKSADVFKTIDALARKDGAQALSMLLEHKKNGDDPIQILGMFAYQVRTLLLIKDAAQNSNDADLSSQLKMHPYVIKKNKPLSNAFEMDELKRLHALIADADYYAKTGREEAHTALQEVVLSFAIK